MAAGLGFKTFNTGDILTAADTNGYLMQGVWVFANAAARSSAVTSPQEGNVSFLKDTNSLEIYDGAAWVAYGAGDITGVTAGTGISGGGTSGSVTITNSMATAIDAKGDLIVGTGADTFDRLAVGGTNGHVLTVDSATSTGLKWAAAGGGGVELISETVASSATSLNLTSIPQTYDHLMLVWHGIQLSDTSSGFTIRFENDSGSNYAVYSQFAYETATSGTTPTLTVNGATETQVGGNRAFGYACNSATVALQSQGRLIIYNYASTTRRKAYDLSFGYRREDNTRFQGANSISGTYLSTTAIDEINIVRIDGSGSFSNSTNTSIRLYGIS